MAQNSYASAHESWVTLKSKEFTKRRKTHEENYYQDRSGNVLAVGPWHNYRCGRWSTTADVLA
jgi:hypothetical protein